MTELDSQNNLVRHFNNFLFIYLFIMPYYRLSTIHINGVETTSYKGVQSSNRLSLIVSI